MMLLYTEPMRLFKNILVWILTLEARLVLAKNKPFIVAVTGSVGKTSTKDAIYDVVKAGGKFTRKSQKSLNSEFGLPLTILGLPNAWHSISGWTANILAGLKIVLFRNEYPACLILELGADHPGDIRNAAKWLCPDIAVITRVSKTPVHVEFFPSPERVFEEKASLASAVKKGGLVVLYSDNERVIALAEELAKKGLKVEQVKVEGVDLDFPLKAARIVGKALGMNDDTISAGLNDYEPPKGRLNVIPGLNDSTIIDDSYNSSPDAAAAALEMLQSFKVNSSAESGSTADSHSGRKIAILGDMMELGKYSAEEHKKIGILASRIADLLITVGPRSKATAASAIANGMPADHVMSFDDSNEAAEKIKFMIMKGDTILIKGSQSPRLEKVTKALLREPEKARELLVRQEPEWLEKA